MSLRNCCNAVYVLTPTADLISKTTYTIIFYFRQSFLYSSLFCLTFPLYKTDLKLRRAKFGGTLPEFIAEVSFNINEPLHYLSVSLQW